MKSLSTENYIKAIYQLQEGQNGTPASTSSLASHLGIAAASVTGMLKRLSATDPKLVEYTPYGGASLTSAGEKMALELIRHHRLIESYLCQALGYTWDNVHLEAEHLEHVISEELEERLASALGDPLTDPHGDPIPDREGHIEQPDYLPLTQLSKGQPASIRRITRQEPELLRYLAELGLTLSTRVQVVSKAPFNGPVSLSVQSHPGSVLALGRDITDKILVLPLSGSAVEVADGKSN